MNSYTECMLMIKTCSPGDARFDENDLLYGGVVPLKFQEKPRTFSVRPNSVYCLNLGTTNLRSRKLYFLICTFKKIHWMVAIVGQRP